jgi:hypothetical protein
LTARVIEDTQVARRITPKDGADAVAMLDAQAKAPRKRTASLHVDPTTGATVPTPKAAPKKAAAPKAPVKKARVTKADKVRAEYMKDPAARPSVVAKATGVEAAYVWDIRAAMQRKGLIPVVAKDAAK